MKTFMLFLVVFAIVFFAGRYASQNAAIMHLYHMMIPPDDLHQSVVQEEFYFHEKGFVQTYQFDSKYVDIYELGIVTIDGFPLSYNFKGKVELEIINESGEILDAKTFGQIASFYTKDNKRLKKIVLGTFLVSGLIHEQENIRVRVSVIKQDDKYDVYKDSAEMYISVTNMP